MAFVLLLHAHGEALCEINFSLSPMGGQAMSWNEIVIVDESKIQLHIGIEKETHMLRIRGDLSDSQIVVALKTRFANALPIFS